MSEKVQQMFASIAGRYDLTNDVLSFGVHRLWRRKLVQLAHISPGQRVLDICCGTGDLAFACKNAVGSSGHVEAIDFVPEMIELAKSKAEQFEDSPSFSVGDAMNLQIESETFDVATVGFGIRNVDNPAECSREILRVLKPQGTFAVLEFGQPRLPIFREIYQLYSDYLMPKIGGLLTGNEEAYRYLPETSQAFIAGESFVSMLKESGFSEARMYPLLWGLAYCYIAVK
jgi:demethylmenaquinone methyltransferase/2-methoxy-6-polyprenyl-1,4-benzoquinol methylase